MRGVRRRAAGLGVIWLARWPRGGDTCGRMDGRDGQDRRPRRTLGARLPACLRVGLALATIAEGTDEPGKGAAHGAHVIGRPSLPLRVGAHAHMLARTRRCQRQAAHWHRHANDGGTTPRLCCSAPPLLLVLKQQGQRILASATVTRQAVGVAFQLRFLASIGMLSVPDKAKRHVGLVD